jgi:hypothetical protein
MEQKWQKLLNLLVIVTDHRSTNSQEEIQEFEWQTKIILPADYKSFCQIIGGGSFNNFAFINNVTNLKRIWEAEINIKNEINERRKNLELNEQELEKIRQEYDPDGTITLYYDLINRSLNFGSASTSEIDYRIYWDLTTYNEQDQSYDIYIDDFGNYEIYKIGRDFFNFITDYCLRIKSWDSLPNRFCPKFSDFYNLFEPFYYEEPSLREQKKITQAIASLKQAFEYEQKKQLTEALILYLNQYSTVDIASRHTSAQLKKIILQAIRRIHQSLGDSLFHSICRTVPNLPFSYQQILSELFGYQSFILNFWGNDNNSFYQFETQLFNIVNNFDESIISKVELEKLNQELINSALAQLTICSNSRFTEFTSFEEEVWWRNIISGAVYKLAQQYLDNNQLEEALILFLQIAKLTQEQEFCFWDTLQQIKVNLASNSIEFPVPYYTNILQLEPLASLKEQLGEAKFEQIYHVVIGKSISPLIPNQESLDEYLEKHNISREFKIRELVRKNRRIWQDFEQPNNYFKNILNCCPNPDEEWFLYWQTFLLSIKKQIAEIVKVDVSLPLPEEKATNLYYFEYLERLHLPPKPLDWFFNSSLRQPIFQDSEKLEHLQQSDPLYKNFRYLKTLRGHSRSVYSIVFSPDGKILASGSADATIKLWDVEKGQEFATLQAHHNSILAVAISSNGKILASGSADGTVKLWNLDNQQEIATLLGHANSVCGVAISSNGRILASGSADCTIKLWDLNNQQEIVTLQGHTDSVFTVAISTDGKILASGSADGTVKLWDLASQRYSHSLHSLCQGLGKVYQLCFCGQKDLLASANGDRILLWNLNAKTAFEIVPGYTSVAASPDGNSLAAGGDLILISDINKRKFVRLLRVNKPPINQDSSIPYHDDYIYAVTYNPNGQMLASASRDCTIKLWGIPQPINF